MRIKKNWKLLLVSLPFFMFGCDFTLSNIDRYSYESEITEIDNLSSKVISTNSIYMFYDKAQWNNPAYYRVLSRNSNNLLSVGTETSITNESISHIAIPVYFNGKLYAFYRDSDDRLRYARYENNNWVINNSVSGSPAIRSAPSVAVYSGHIHIVFRGNNSPFKLYHTYATNIDTNTWTPFEYVAAKSEDTPSLAVHNNRLWLFYSSQDTDKIYNRYYTSTWSGEYFTGSYQNEGSVASVSSNGQLYLFIKDNYGRITFKSSQDGITWGGIQYAMGAYTSKGPAIVAFDNLIYIFTRNDSNGYIYYKLLNTQTNTQTPANSYYNLGVQAYYEPGVCPIY